jgi:hypothetical protein
MGYCGGHVEETLIQHFHQVGLNWALFEAYVNRLQNAINTGDTSIFRKPSAPVSPIKPKP